MTRGTWSSAIAFLVVVLLTVLSATVVKSSESSSLDAAIEDLANWVCKLYEVKYLMPYGSSEQLRAAHELDMKIEELGEIYGKNVITSASRIAVIELRERKRDCPNLTTKQFEMFF